MFFNKKEKEEVVDIDSKIIDNIKALNIDIINTKHNGNFDISLSLTKTLYMLYSKHLKINPKDPNWVNRDRVVLSSFSAYSVLLAVLFMSGYDIELDDLKNAYKSKNKVPGVDIISDVFGEGIANACGIAIGERYLEEYFKNKKLYDFYTYVICTDLDLIKGTTYESLSLASTLKLNKLVVIFDNNKNVLGDKDKDIYNMDAIKYFESLNLNTIVVDNNLSDIDNAIIAAKASDKPTVIILNHDNDHDRFENNYIDNDFVLTEEKITTVKEELGVRDIPYTVSSEAVSEMQESINNRMEKELANWKKAYDELDDDTKEILDNWKINNTSLANSNINYKLEENESLDQACFKILNLLGKDNIFFMGGTSNFNRTINDQLVEFKPFSSKDYPGKNINYGLRNSATGSIQNGLSLIGIKNFSITSLKTISKIVPSIKIAGSYNLSNIYIIIEDENTFIDGVNTEYNSDIIGLRNIPNLDVFRPADINELIGVFKIVTEKKNGPSCIIVNAHIDKAFDTTSITDVKKGAYIVAKEDKNIGGVIIASGNELKLALEVNKTLKEKGIDTRVISMPSVELYINSKDNYQDDLIPFGTKVFVIEKTSSFGWYRFVYNDKYLITPDIMEWYDNETLYDEFKNKVIEKIEKLLN